MNSNERILNSAGPRDFSQMLAPPEFTCGLNTFKSLGLRERIPWSGFCQLKLVSAFVAPIRYGTGRVRTVSGALSTNLMRSQLTTRPRLLSRVSWIICCWQHGQGAFPNQAHPLSRATIVEQVWRLNVETKTNVVDVYVNYLRRKVDAGYDRPLIRTIRGTGYQIGTNGFAS